MKKATAISSMTLAVVLVCLPVTAWAESLSTEIMLNASDADVGDELGQAVAISGNIAIVGADRDDDNGKSSGSAYLFDVTTGNQLFKLLASDGISPDALGHSVVIDGNRALVAAISDDDDVLGKNTGGVYLYDVTTGTEIRKLTASDAAAGDQFGHGIGISGNRMIVGSYFKDAVGSNSGQAYIYDTTTGEELFKLIPSDAAANDWFGYWTAINDEYAIVSSRRNDDGGTDSGSVYVFDVNTGEELMKLTASDATAGDEFGYAVAIDGTTLVVGTWGSNRSQGRTGAAYVFDVTTGEELFKLTASDGEFGDEFGYAVGISGDTVVVGAYGDDDDVAGRNAGSAYLYDLTFGDELAKITASDAAAVDEFGTAVGISGNVIISGAWYDDSNGTHAGQAYSYDISDVLPPGADFNNDGVVNNADLLQWESSSPIPRLDVNGDEQVDGADFLLWQQSYQDEIAFVESPANLDQLGPVDGSDLLILEQSYSVDGQGDVDGDGDTDGLDFLEWQREYVLFDDADENLDRLVDGYELALWNASFRWDADIDGDGHLDGDADGDGDVDDRDFQWWQKHSTEAPPAASSSAQVPEPASAIVLMIGMATLIFRRHAVVRTA